MTTKQGLQTISQKDSLAFLSALLPTIVFPAGIWQPGHLQISLFAPII